MLKSLQNFEEDEIKLEKKSKIKEEEIIDGIRIATYIITDKPIYK